MTFFFASETEERVKKLLKNYQGKTNQLNYLLFLKNLVCHISSQSLSAGDPQN
jgi:hypothetical protein